MKTWTVNEMLAERQYYDRDIVTALWAGRERLSLIEIFSLPIRIPDKIWVATMSNALDMTIRHM